MKFIIKKYFFGSAAPCVFEQLPFIRIYYNKNLFNPTYTYKK